jgi:hypothetical protein
LAATVSAANDADFRIKIAVIRTRYELGTAFSLYNKAQKYAQFLGLELSFQYRGRLLVVMPKGYGYAINGRADRAGLAVLRELPPPGTDRAKQLRAAATAVRRLAAASGHTLPAVGDDGGSETRDRLTLAAAALALVALLAAFALFRRGRT